jgi:phage FluMu protein Com
MTLRCQECNEAFEQKRYWQKFCSPACRNKQSIRDMKEHTALGRKAKAQMNAARLNSRDLFEAA